MVTANVKEPSLLKQLDWITIALFLVLVVLGWFSICGASYEYGQPDFFNPDLRSGKQLIWIGCSFVVAFVILMLDDKVFDTFAYVIYIAFMGLLLITPFIATDIKGSYSWIKLGSLSIQPAEFAKCATALALAKFMGHYGYDIRRPKEFAATLGLILLPMALIVMQRETGSALIYTAFFLMLYREGMNGSVLFAGFAAVLYFVVGLKFTDLSCQRHPHFDQRICGAVDDMVFHHHYNPYSIFKPHTRPANRGNRRSNNTAVLSFLAVRHTFRRRFGNARGDCRFNNIPAHSGVNAQAIEVSLHSPVCRSFVGFFFSTDYVMNNVLEYHQQQRVKVLLGIEQDLSGAGYNVNQSKIAIGSGGILGKGFLNGTQTKLKYVPEQDTDFIFCTIGEEKGFVGAAVVLIIYLCLILRLITLAERQSFAFGRIFGYCVLSIFLFHMFINVGMVIGLTPVIGIPLPFFSYGGSSLWGFTILLFIFLRIDAARKV